MKNGRNDENSWDKKRLAIEIISAFIIAALSGYVGIRYGKGTNIYIYNGQEISEAELDKIMKENDEVKEFISNAEIGIEVTDEYYYIFNEDRAKYFLVVKNISDKNIRIDASVLAKDSTGNILGAEKDFIKVLAPRQEAIMDFYFDDAGAAENFEYTLIAEENKKDESYIDKITCEVSINKNKLIILITNSGEEDIDNVIVQALFFSGGEIIDSDKPWDVQIKAGNTIPVQLECSEGEFDDFQLYVYGYVDK